MAPIWVQTLSALFVPMIAIAVGVIAYFQWQTNKNRLKLELFDRRVKYYEAALQFIGDTMAENEVSGESLLDFRHAQYGSAFLLNDGVTEYLKELWKNGSDAKVLRSEFERLQPGDDRNKIIQEHSDAVKWIREQPEILQHKFEPFLKIKT